MSFKTTLRAALTATFAFVLSPAFANGIEIHEAYAISSIPGAPTGAAFMIIHNHGGPADRLVGVRSDAAERVELHTHVMDSDGVMRMIHVEEGFELATDGEIILERGGNHIMFLGLVDPLTAGEAVTVTLEFEVSGDLTIEIPIGDMATEGAGMDHGSMDHGTMDHATTEPALSE
jgi:copper(I)-binding protein